MHILLFASPTDSLSATETLGATTRLADHCLARLGVPGVVDQAEAAFASRPPEPKSLSSTSKRSKTPPTLRKLCTICGGIWKTSFHLGTEFPLRCHGNVGRVLHVSGRLHPPPFGLQEPQKGYPQRVGLQNGSLKMATVSFWAKEGKRSPQKHFALER